MDKFYIPRFKFSPRTDEMVSEKISEFSYESPIELIVGQMRLEHEKRVEGEVIKAVQEVGVIVNKDELIKALRYDREQYKKGFADGCKANTVKLCQEVKADTLGGIQTRFAMHFGTYTPEETVKVSDVFRLLDRITKEMLEETK